MTTKRNVIEWLEKCKDLFIKEKAVSPSFIIIPPEIEKEIWAAEGECVKFKGNNMMILEMMIIRIPIYEKIVVLMNFSGDTEKYYR